jgi:hypothetical protein
MSHKKYRTETNCLNCGAEVQGKFCSNCGQENLDVRENFFHVAFHFVSDYFHFDSKFFRSMVPLFTRPGFLTRQYWDGKRVNYIHPLRLYFFSIIVAVLCTGFFYNHFEGDVKGKLIDPQVSFTPDSTDLRAAQESGDSLQYIEQLRKREVERIKKETVSRLGGGIDHFIHDLKYVSFFLLPVYALIFKFLYMRRKSFYVDHLVYTMHLQSFAMLTMGLLLMISLLVPKYVDVIARLTYVAIFVYILISLRNLYQQSWLKTVMKSIVATVLTVAAMGIVAAIYMGITLITEQEKGDNVNFKFESNVEHPETKKE